MTDMEFRLDVVERLTRIEGKVDAVKNHENRLRSLEQWRWMIAGALALVIFSVPVVLHFVK